MSRLIDAEPLDCLAWKDGEHGTTFDDGVRWVLSKIDELPTIEERKTGKWIDAVVAGVLPVIVCDQCNTFFPLQFGASHNFCPNCGADMRGESDDIPIEYFESGGI